MFDILLKNGNIVTAEREFKGDIAISGDKIAEVAPCIEAEAKRVIDLTGKDVIPGAVEGHIHCMGSFMGCSGINDFYMNSISGAFGGVTTFMDFSNSKAGVPITESSLEKLELMSMSAINYTLHPKFLETCPNVLDDIQKLVDMGLPTFKLYMTYKKGGTMCSDEMLLKAFHRAKECGALPLLHCESDVIAQYNIDQLIENNVPLTWAHHYLTKPDVCEAEAFSRAYYYARNTECAILAVHTTVRDAFDLARKAHMEDDFPVYLETCTQYVTTFNDVYNKKDGYLMLVSPPLRSKENAQYIWKAMADGTITITGTDDTCYTREDKERFLEKDENGEFIQDFRKVVNGNPGMELRLPILLSEGVAAGRITMRQLVKLTSANIARLYGCYPQKGTIQKMADADLAIIDRHKSWVVSQDTLHNNMDYCPMNGRRLTGKVEMTICNGKIIVENDTFHGSRGEGRFVKRSMDPSVLQYYSAMA